MTWQYVASKYVASNNHNYIIIITELFHLILLHLKFFLGVGGCNLAITGTNLNSPCTNDHNNITKFRMQEK